MDELDHPIVFVFLMAIALLGAFGLMTWGFKHVGWSGPAMLVQTP